MQSLPTANCSLVSLTKFLYTLLFMQQFIWYNPNNIVNNRMMDTLVLCYFKNKQILGLDPNYICAWFFLHNYPRGRSEKRSWLENSMQYDNYVEMCFYFILRNLILKVEILISDPTNLNVKMYFFFEYEEKKSCSSPLTLKCPWCRQPQFRLFRRIYRSSCILNSYQHHCFALSSCVPPFQCVG